MAALLVPALLLVGFWAPLARLSATIYENVSFALAPSAALAASFGERHFDSRNAAQYDLNRARHFYRAALALDPAFPYANHQLARIEFIRGNFNVALYYSSKEIEFHGDTEPNAYYVRGLIEGYMGRYEDAIKDYKHYVESDPKNWAGQNDYAWVLLKAGRPREALAATEQGLAVFPDNPWLLSTNAIALYEVGEYEKARAAAERAREAAARLTENEWLRAYPGNDPRVAQKGIATLRSAITQNMHRIEAALASSTAR